jgi:hypothetical protein
MYRMMAGTSPMAVPSSSTRVGTTRRGCRSAAATHGPEEAAKVFSYDLRGLLSEIALERHASGGGVRRRAGGGPGRLGTAHEAARRKKPWLVYNEVTAQLRGIERRAIFDSNSNAQSDAV